jgi:hypothetical protein
MICAVTSLYRQCLADQSFPSLATLYMQEVDDFFSLMQQTTCNNTQSSSDISTVAGTVLVVQMFKIKKSSKL